MHGPRAARNENAIEVGLRYAAMLRAVPNRSALYLTVNVAFTLVVAAGAVVSGFPDPRVAYLVLLFALCTTSVIDLDGLNGRYAPLAYFMFVYFVSFGVVDFTNVLTGGDGEQAPVLRPPSGFLSTAEMIILVGGIMLVLSYRLTVRVLGSKEGVRHPKDWTSAMVLIVGLVFWAVGTVATYRWNVYIVPDTTNEAFRKGLGSISPAVTTAYLLGQMCQPLGMLLLAYEWSVRRPHLLILIIAMVLIQIFIGFVVDVKGLAMLGIILVLMTSLLVSGRLPKVWLAGGLLFVSLIYPYFTAYRTAIHGAGIARTAAVEHFAEILERTIAAKDKVNSGRDRAQTFLERSNVKGSVEVVARKAGADVPFEWGYTLSPILETFIPKIFWSDKQRIPTGQLFNKRFHIVEGDEVYISPSHLGELYWNFGWAGVVLGMTVIGVLCGWVGARFNLTEYVTVTRVLVTLITIKQLIVVFESTISDCYVVWLRSLAAIAVLHVIFARIPAASRFFVSARSSPGSVAPVERGGGRPFPNLLT
jgi:hypothetical protein